MMRSLYAGISGLRNFQTKMDIIGNNIANVNTIAFKSSRITFAETMAQTLSGEIAPTEGQGGINSVQVGLGMRTLGIDTNFSQGSMESTGVKTDLAIQGDGFFMVTSNDKVNYTRAGAFQIDAEGNLVTAGSGHKLMGYMSDTIGNQINRSSPKSIQIPLGSQSKARSTTEVTLAGNLDMNMTNSFAALIESGATGITNVAGTAKDGLGGVHTITVSGTDATQSSGSFGTELNPYDTLNSLGVATTEGFSISIDGRPGVLITGLTSQSRLDELVKSINSQVDGVTAVLSEGAITVSRDYHGIGESNDIDVHTYFFEITDREGIEGTGISQAIFGGTSILVNNGTSGNLSVVDSFVPKGELDANATQFELLVTRSNRTGLATGIKDFGDGGVQVSAPEGLTEGVAVIETEETNHTTSIMVYDSLGKTTSVEITYKRTDIPGTWKWSIDLPEPAVIVEGGTGSISFNKDGSLENFIYDASAGGLVFNPGNGAQTVELSFDSGTFGGFDGITQSASPASMIANNQDGYGMGSLQGIFFDSNGRIFGNFTNGKTEELGQVLLANFTNPQGLERVGENLYKRTTNSGEPRIGEASLLGARINAGFLEGSNVDLSREFTDMILAQRAFQASARVITTSDALLEEVTRLKR